MTPQQLIARIWPPVDKTRIEKAQQTARRQRLDWQLVLDAMTDDQRKAIQDA